MTGKCDRGMVMSVFGHFLSCEDFFSYPDDCRTPIRNALDFAVDVFMEYFSFSKEKCKKLKNINYYLHFALYIVKKYLKKLKLFL